MQVKRMFARIVVVEYDLDGLVLAKDVSVGVYSVDKWVDRELSGR